MSKIDSEEAFQSASAPISLPVEIPDFRGPFHLTKLTAIRPNVLSKRYYLEDGRLRKKTAAALSEGRIKTLTLKAPEDLQQVLAGLSHADALMLGTATDPNAAQIVARRMLLESSGPGVVARTADNFRYSEGGGFLFLDHDGLPGGRYLSLEEILDCLYKLCPALRGIKLIAFPSSSSHICRTDTDEDLTGARGIHLYIPVADGRDIPRAGAVLNALSWRAGQGFIMIAQNGNRLLRTFFDTAVWQPNRLIFASGAICGNGLAQRRGLPILINPDGADALDTGGALPALDEATLELVKALQNHARAEKKAEADAIQAAWLQEKRPALLRALGTAPHVRETRKSLIAAVEDRILESDFMLLVRRPGETGFKPRSVREVLADRLGHHRAITLDPIEPDYNGHAEVGMLFLDGHKPVLHSMAHGGATYQLKGTRRVINVAPGDLHEAMQAAIAHMSEDSRFYNWGDMLTTVHRGERVVLDEYGLEYLLAGSLAFRAPNRRGDLVAIEMPPRMLAQLVRPSAVRQLRPLLAVLTHPTITGDGKLLERPGYHEGPQFYLDYDSENWPSVRTELTDAEARDLIETIWAPFRGFPFVDSASRGAVIAGILTAILRASFETAPAFASVAPDVGSGKTIAMQAVVSIASGTHAAVTPPYIGDESELRKQLTSTALSGSMYLLIDNAEDMSSIPTLQAFLTGTGWNDRQLSTNRMLRDLPIRIFFGMTGSNLSFSRDMQRRVISWRIDPQVQNAASRMFTWSPTETALTNRKEIITAALGLVLAAQKADLPPVTEHLGSYTTWERIVRTTLRYIERVSAGRFADPVPRTLENTAENDETRALHHLHIALLDSFGWEPFSASDVLHETQRAVPTELSDALTGATGRSEALSSKSIGRYMRRFVDRPVWGLVLRVIPGQKALVYRLESHEPSEKSPAQMAFEYLAEKLGIPGELFEQDLEIGGRLCRVEAIDQLHSERPIRVRDVSKNEVRIISVDDLQSAMAEFSTPTG